MQETFNSLRMKAEKDLKELDKKTEITASEWANAKTLLSAMCKMKELEMYSGNGNESYDRYNMPRTDYFNMYDDRNSGRRGRSTRTGRYISMDGRSYDDMNSGHSITDRMVDQIERMYDSAKTDYERRELDKWINRIQNGD